MTLMAVAGQVGIGYLHNSHRNYQVALTGVIAALVTSTFFYLLMGRYPGKTESPVAETMPDPGFSRAG